MNRPNFASANQRRAASRSAGTESRPCAGNAAIARTRRRAVIISPAGWGSGNASGAGVDRRGGRGRGGEGGVDEGGVDDALYPYPPPVPRPSPPFSYDPIHHCPEEHHDPDD